MDKNKFKTTLRTLKPNFHLNVSLEIIRYFGSWPPERKNRFVYFIFSALVFYFVLGHFILEEVANLIVNRGSFTKIVSVTPILMTNIVHAYKVFFYIKLFVIEILIY